MLLDEIELGGEANGRSTRSNGTLTLADRSKYFIRLFIMRMSVIVFLAPTTPTAMLMLMRMPFYSLTTFVN